MEKPVESSGRRTLDVPTCHLERAEFQEEAKLFGWSRIISSLLSPPLQTVVALRPVAAVRGSS